jgi:FtsP/CotA-like multicopper oxidase with cupredoxin domain
MTTRTKAARLFSRRNFLTATGLAGGLGVGSTLVASAAQTTLSGHPGHGLTAYGHGAVNAPLGGNITVGEVDHARNGFDPHRILNDWDGGLVETLPDGRRLRTYEVVAADIDMEIAPGVFFPAWTYNGRVPGPTLRATEGDLLRLKFHNGGTHPHSMHFHGIHNARVDGVPGAGVALPNESFIYEFTARPFGCHLYHCHVSPLRQHIHKGMYGAFIVDPDPARHPGREAQARARLLGTPENARWQEFVLVMNGFDTNFDGENEFYAVNTIAFAYALKPIRIDRSRPVRIYLINVTEFDPINSLHLHANFFDFYDHGTTLEPTSRTIDTVMMCQAQRGILEFTFAEHEPGLYMVHAHQSELAELGWMAHFEVVEAIA